MQQILYSLISSCSEPFQGGSVKNTKYASFYIHFSGNLKHSWVGSDSKINIQSNVKFRLYTRTVSLSRKMSRGCRKPCACPRRRKRGNPQAHQLSLGLFWCLDRRLQLSPEGWQVSSDVWGFISFMTFGTHLSFWPLPSCCNIPVLSILFALVPGAPWVLWASPHHS